MKILHIITDTNIGGAGKLLVALIKNIDRSEFDISVAVPRKSALIPLLESAGARVIQTEYGKDKSYERRAVKELKKIIRDERPDIVHTHASLSGRVAAYLCGVKARVMTRHCAFENKKSATRFPKKQIRTLFENALTTRYVATANVAERQLVEVGCDKNRITVIKNGSERVREISDEEKTAQRVLLGIPKDGFVVGIAARLEDYKGHRYLLEAAKLLSKDDIYYLVVGDGSLAKQLRLLSHDLGIEKNTVFTGFASDMAMYYGIMDVGVNCSYGTETTPLAVTEAMSVGVPSVVSDYGGNPDTVTNGYDGIVVAQKDADALASAILSLYEDGEELSRLSKNARISYIDKYSAAAMARKYEKLYMSIVKHSEEA